MRILVIEDEKEIQDLLNNHLTESGYQVTVADDGIDGIAKFHAGSADLILLDIMLPKIDGFTVCELIRRESDVPIIIVTARDSMEDQVRGLKLAADDYIPKPFHIPVLLCKIETVLRRVRKNGICNHLTYKELSLDLSGHHAYLSGREMDLTQKEFELLRVFLTEKGRVFTRQVLLDQVWGMDYFGDERIVDTHIKNIRRKLDSNYIQTVRGVGYRVEKECKE